jgi:hypothetical protein
MNKFLKIMNLLENQKIYEKIIYFIRKIEF